MMSKEKRRVPKLRFPGFTEDWEQRKLSDISTKVTTKNVDVHYTETLTNSAEQGIISQVDFFDKEISNKDNINGYYIVDNNDFIYNPRISTLAPVGPINRNKLNRTGIMSPLYTVFRSSNVDLGFLEWYFQSSHWHRYMKLNGDSGVRADRIAIKDSTFFEMPIKIPVNIKEQVLIGETLEKFNQYITLHQRKLDNLKLKKKALLQKLFPKNGERYPELRFPGFTDAWEQRKLNEFLSVSNFKNTENKYNKKDVLSVSGDYGIVNQIDFQGRSFAGASVSNYGVVEKGDIVYTKSPLKLNPYGIIKTNRLNNGIVSTLYAIYKTKENCNSKFIEHYFNLDSRLNQYLKPLVNKGAKNDMKVSSENVLIGEVCFPKITEQALIADFLDCLDIYITLHQRKLEHLKLQKKALLQQMFV
ncbi:MAG: restriction endonuclease subunit S [Veillonella sp.]|nr:restriction endonuclease subunit S [Veillonella sp.]